MNAISETDAAYSIFAHFDASPHADYVCDAIVHVWVCAQRDSLFFNCFLFVRFRESISFTARTR